MQPILVSRKDAAILLSISLRSVDNLVGRGELKPVRLGKKVLFRREALEHFARRSHETQRVSKG